MSDIKVGDLVLVAKACPHCGDTDGLGMIFLVFEIFSSDRGANCCGYTSGMSACATDPRNHNQGFDVQLLKRIPPLSELEGEKRDEEITA